MFSFLFVELEQSLVERFLSRPINLFLTKQKNMGTCVINREHRDAIKI